MGYRLYYITTYDFFDSSWDGGDAVFLKQRN
jgi:hypothetical protein